MPLSPQEIAALAGRLDESYRTLIDEVRTALEHSENQQYVELIDRVPADIGDQSVGDLLADLNLTMIDRHVVEARAIDAARARLREGRYGVCIDCGEEIEYRRLCAAPAAQRCVPCQTQHEKTHAGGGTPTL